MQEKVKPLLHVETFSWDLLHGETLVFVTTAIVATVAEVESGSTFRETCLATDVQKVYFTKPTLLHGATPAETCFATPLRTSFTELKVSTCNNSFRVRITFTRPNSLIKIPLSHQSIIEEFSRRLHINTLINMNVHFNYKLQLYCSL